MLVYYNLRIFFISIIVFKKQEIAVLTISCV